jgi:hypothetical protein
VVPSFDPLVAPFLAVGSPVSDQLGATGWPAPRFSASSALPPGLTLTPDGVLSGTPTIPGSYPVSVLATNPAGSSVLRMSLTVDGGFPAAIAASGAMSTVTSTPFAQHLTASLIDAYGNPMPDYPLLFALPTTGPSGLFANGSRTLTVNTDANGFADAGMVTANALGGSYAATVGLGLEIQGHPVPVASVPLTNIAVDVAPTFTPTTAATATARMLYSFRFPTTGTPTPTVTLAGGALPPGLTLAPDGTVSGTPTSTGTYSFSLRAANSAGSATSTASITVQSAPRLGIAGTSVAEGDRGTTRLRFRLTLSRAGTVPVTVHWATAGGTATAGTDYLAGSGSLTFAPGTVRATAVVLVLGDTHRERNETVVVRLSSPTGATLGVVKATGTVLNDD